MSVISVLREVLRPYKWGFFFIFLTFTLGTVLAQLKPVLLQQVIDSAIEGTPLLHYVLLFALLLLFVNVFFRVMDFIFVNVLTSSASALRKYAADTILQHSYSFFINTFSGSLVAKSKRFANSIWQLFNETLFSLYSAVLMILLASVVIAFYDIRISLLIIAWFIVYASITIYLRRKQRPFDEDFAQEESKFTGRLADVFTNVFALHSFGTVRRENKKLASSIDVLRVKEKRSLHFVTKILAVQSFLLAILEVGLLYISVRAYQNGTMSLGILLMIQIYALSIFGFLWNFGRGVQKVSKSLSDMKELVDIAHTPVDLTDVQNPLPAKIKTGDISFEHICFSYDNKTVFDNFSLRIPAGQKVGLVGLSGSGKTTLTKLLLRFMDPQQGTIRIDGQDISLLKQASFRQAITYVPQEPLLFHRSLKENIAYAKPSASLKQVIKAAKQAHAHEFIEQLPQKYATLVGERGVKLSGGERQRVAIARSLLKDAPIVVMDEATSSLDTTSEKYIQEATEKLMKKKTAIIIAHRLATVRNLDRIIVLHKGKIVEQGTHRYLLSKKGHYYKLYRNQQL